MPKNTRKFVYGVKSTIITNRLKDKLVEAEVAQRREGDHGIRLRRLIRSIRRMVPIIKQAEYAVYVVNLKFKNIFCEETRKIGPNFEDIARELGCVKSKILADQRILQANVIISRAKENGFALAARQIEIAANKFGDSEDESASEDSDDDCSCGTSESEADPCEL